MKKQLFTLVFLSFLFYSGFSFSQSIENLIDYPNQINSISVLSANDIRILTSTGEIFKTDNLFRNFELVCQNSKFGFDFIFSDEISGYCLGFGDEIFSTGDAGRIWDSTIINRKSRTVYALTNMLVLSRDELLVCGIRYNNVINNHTDINNYSGVIVRISEGEVSEVFSSPKSSVNRIYTIENICYAAGSANLILKSTDRGLTWITLTTKSDCVYNDIFFLNESTGYFVGSKNDAGIITYTYDGCRKWTSKEIPNSALRSVYAFNMDSIVLIGDDNKIFCTINGCRNFSKTALNKDLNTSLHNFYPIDGRNLLFLATHIIEDENNEIVNSSTTIYKLNPERFFSEYSLKLSRELYRNDLLAFMKTAAEDRATTEHPASKIENIEMTKIGEKTDSDNTHTEENEYTVKMKGSILGINEFVLKIRVTGKLEFDILGTPKYSAKEIKVIQDRKL
ncbi:MAG: hypothetical protein HY959_07625 [Ignavibacteriae bacterium]|nr:hypothetical protein [Ignavibacteriota bacterium]